MMTQSSVSESGYKKHNYVLRVSKACMKIILISLIRIQDKKLLISLLRHRENQFFTQNVAYKQGIVKFTMSIFNQRYENGPYKISVIKSSLLKSIKKKIVNRRTNPFGTSTYMSRNLDTFLCDATCLKFFLFLSFILLFLIFEDIANNGRNVTIK